MRRIYTTEFVVPGGTLQSAPHLQAVQLEDNNLDLVRIIVPDGHVGFTGLRITWGGTQVVPFGTGTWWVANNELMDLALDQEVTADGLQLAGYNTDVFDHTFWLRWLVSDLPPRTVAAITSAQAGGAAAADTSVLGDLAAADTGVPADSSGLAGLADGGQPVDLGLPVPPLPFVPGTTPPPPVVTPAAPGGKGKPPTRKPRPPGRHR